MWSSTGSKKKLPATIADRRAWIDPSDARMSIGEQCALLGLSRSTYYHAGVGESDENLALMRMIDEQYLETPFYGSRRMTQWLLRQGCAVNRKRVQRLLRLMNLEAIYPRQRTSTPGENHRIYPYLLRNVMIDRVDQVWSTDITYVPLSRGYMYLAAVIDWHSRYVLSWELSNTLDSRFCVKALQAALTHRQPEIFNTDQGAQFTSEAFTGVLLDAGIAISMDGRGRALDNVFIERLWRSVKYENIYPRGYETVPALAQGLAFYFEFYNHERIHMSLDYATPWEVYSAGNRGRRGQTRNFRAKNSGRAAGL
jgi:putative transposase